MTRPRYVVVVWQQSGPWCARVVGANAYANNNAINAFTWAPTFDRVRPVVAELISMLTGAAASAFDVTLAKVTDPARVAELSRESTANELLSAVREVLADYDNGMGSAGFDVRIEELKRVYLRMTGWGLGDEP